MPNDLKQITSSEFRVKYAQLREPHEVRVLGLLLGTWYPAERSPLDVTTLAEPVNIEFRPVPKPFSKKRKKLL